jgi:hypothetical protein
MTDDWSHEGARGDVRLGRRHAFGKPRDRHADIARDRLGAGT